MCVLGTGRFSSKKRKPEIPITYNPFFFGFWITRYNFISTHFSTSFFLSFFCFVFFLFYSPLWGRWQNKHFGQRHTEIERVPSRERETKLYKYLFFIFFFFTAPMPLRFHLIEWQHQQNLHFHFSSFFCCCLLLLVHVFSNYVSWLDHACGAFSFETLRLAPSCPCWPITSRRLKETSRKDNQQQQQQQHQK